MVATQLLTLYQRCFRLLTFRDRTRPAAKRLDPDIVHSVQAGSGLATATATNQNQQRFKTHQDAWGVDWLTAIGSSNVNELFEELTGARSWYHCLWKESLLDRKWFWISARCSIRVRINYQLLVVLISCEAACQLSHVQAAFSEVICSWSWVGVSLTLLVICYLITVDANCCSSVSLSQIGDL